MVMGPVPLPILVGAFAVVLIGVVYVIWARKSKQQPQAADKSSAQ
jgi:hypothetical protein